MLRNFNIKFSHLNLNVNSVCVQSIRWRRKPRWLPTAPSKVFRVPKKTILPHEESIEWQRLNNHYRTQMNSLRRFLINEVEDRKVMAALQETPADEEAEFQRCFEINEKWNQEISKFRDLRVERDNEMRKKEILVNISNREVREKKIRTKIEDKVMKEKKISNTFITAKNIDEAIEYALANPISYNFSIDLQGKRSDDDKNKASNGN